MGVLTAFPYWNCPDFYRRLLSLPDVSTGVSWRILFHGEQFSGFQNLQMRQRVFQHGVIRTSALPRLLFWMHMSKKGD